MILANTIKIKDNRSTYPGGKGGSGVHQNIINLIPPHGVYIETHLGGGSILRYKRPAALNIGIDLDPEVVEAWIRSGTIKNNGAGSGTASPKIQSGDGRQYFSFINNDASSYLKKYKFTGNEFIYVDPPYLMETRKGGKLYNFEYTDHDHIELLTVLKTLPCMVMISGYWSPLYSEMLPGWNTHNFKAQTRQGMATEWLWFNYQIPEKLHDYRYIGENFKKREHIKNKRKRWISRFKKLPAIERNAMLESLIIENNDASAASKMKMWTISL